MTTIHRVMTKTCIFLFFRFSASKLMRLLITAYATDTNQFQREFDSNVAIRTFDHEPSAPKNKPSQTKPPSISPLHQRACECSGEGLGVGFAFG
jgi:hypothetical protein